MDTQLVIPADTQLVIPADTQFVIPADTQLVIPVDTQFVIPADTQLVIPAKAGIQSPIRFDAIDRPPMKYITPSHRWWKPFRQVGDATIVHLDLTLHASREASALSWLDCDERERWRKFEHAGARRRFVLCRAALRAILQEELRCDNERLAFGELRHGKPFALLDNTPVPISFNVSHSGRHGLIAIAPKGRLGVDVEERTDRRDFDRLIEAAFGPHEQIDLKRERASGKFHLFYKLWTVKEALIKALGTGLSLDPATFEAPAAMRQGATASAYRFPHIPEANWHIEDIGNEQFAAALAFDV